MVSNDTVRDLAIGVLIDNRLKFYEHVSTVTKKANHVLAIVHKSFEYMDNGTFDNYLYRSLLDQRSVNRRCKGEQPS